MRLHRLTLTAFGPFGTTTEVDFDGLSSVSLFLLHGPTGAGKTSVLDAVCYALYGAVPGARQSPGTSLRSDHADPATPTEVLLELTAAWEAPGDHPVARPVPPQEEGRYCTTEKAQSRLRAYDPDKGWQALSKSHQEIGEEITQLLGMSRDQFCQVVLLPQGDFARFLRADAEARGKLLGRLFDTRRFAAVEERLAELRRAAESRVRAGDERVLAIAQRLAQAAGPVAETPCPPSSPANPASPKACWGGRRPRAPARGSGWRSPASRWPPPRSAGGQPGTRWTRNSNGPVSSSGSRRPGGARPLWKRAAPNATVATNAWPGPARRS